MQPIVAAEPTQLQNLFEIFSEKTVMLLLAL